MNVGGKKYWHCNISQSRAKTSGDNLLYYIIIITIITINMLIHQDTDERHTALIAAVNNNDAKVPPEVFTFLSKLQNWRLIKIFQVVDALMEHPDLDMNKRYICVNGNNGDIVLMTIKMMRMSLRDRNGVTAYQLAKARNYTGILRLFAKSKLILQVRWSWNDRIYLQALGKGNVWKVHLTCLLQDLKVQLNLLRSTQKWAPSRRRCPRRARRC